MRVAAYGKLRRVLLPYLALAVSALVALAGASAMVEMVYHLQLNSALGPSLHFLGLTLDAKSVAKSVGQASKQFAKTSKSVSKDIERAGDQAERIGKILDRPRDGSDQGTSPRTGIPERDGASDDTGERGATLARRGRRRGGPRRRPGDRLAEGLGLNLFRRRRSGAALAVAGANVSRLQPARRPTPPTTFTRSASSSRTRTAAHR